MPYRIGVKLWKSDTEYGLEIQKECLKILPDVTKKSMLSYLISSDNVSASADMVRMDCIVNNMQNFTPSNNAAERDIF